jgi:DNA-binding response OmpR family regulator
MSAKRFSPSRPSLSPRGAQSTATSANRRLLEDVECLAEGGWRPAVSDVAYLLRCHGRHIQADNLEMAAHYAHFPSSSPTLLEEETAILNRVRNQLADVKNSAKKDLPPKIREELRLLLNTAIERIAQRLNAIPGQVAKVRRATRNVSEIVLDKAEGPLSLCMAPAGFFLGNQVHDLTGRPRDMLQRLLEAPHRRCTAAELRKSMDVDDESVDSPEQVIKDTAKKLRHSLKKALMAAGRSVENPLPSKGKGKDLSYILAIS